MAFANCQPYFSDFGFFDWPARRGEASDASRLLADASLAIQRAFGVTAEPRLLDPDPATAAATCIPP